MKKESFILLTFFIPFFTAASFFKDKPTNVVLSTHLKNVRNDIKQELQKFAQDDNKLQQKLDQDYIVTANIFNNFFDITSLTDIFTKIEQLWFYLICNYLRTIYTVNDTDNTIIQQALAALNIQDSYIAQIEYLKANWVQIIKPLLITYCSPTDTRTTEEKMNSLILSDDSLNIGYILINKRILTPLLQDIENKIKEL